MNLYLLNKNKLRIRLFVSLTALMLVVLSSVLLIFYFHELITNKYIPMRSAISNFKNNIIKVNNEISGIHKLQNYAKITQLSSNVETAYVELQILVKNEVENSFYKSINGLNHENLLLLQKYYFDYNKALMKILSDNTPESDINEYQTNYAKVIQHSSTIQDLNQQYLIEITSLTWLPVGFTLLVTFVVFIFMLLLIHSYFSKYITANTVLSETNGFLSELLVNLNDAILFEDAKGNVVYMNQKFPDLLGCTENKWERMIGAKSSNVVLEGSTFFKDPKTFIADINTCKEAKVPEFNVIYELNNERVLERDYKPIYVGNKLYGHLWVYRDITDSITYKKNIEQSEKQYRYLFEQNPNPMWIFDKKTLKFLEVNQAAIRKYGYTREEFLELDVLKIRPEEEVEKALLIIKGNESKDFERITDVIHTTKDGTLLEVELFAHNLIFEGKQCKFILVNDVTELNKAQKNLLYYQEHLENIIDQKDLELVIANQNLETTNDQMYMAMQAGEMAWWEWYVENDYLEYHSIDLQLVGFDAGELGNSYHAFTLLLHPEDYENTMHAMLQLILGEKDVYETEYRLKSKSGEWLWFKDVGKVIETFPDNSPKRISGMAQNITSQKKIEKDIRKWHLLMQNADWGIAIAPSVSTKYEKTNLAFAKMHGYEPDDYSVLDALNLVAPDSRDDYFAFLKNVMQNNHATVELMHMRKDGSRFPALISATLFKETDSNEYYRIVNIQNISERVKFEQNNRLWAKLIQNAKWGVYITKVNSFEFELMNDAFATMHGYTVNELKALSSEALMAEEMLPSIAIWSEMVRKNGNVIFESINLTKNGDLIPVLVNVTLVKDEETKEEFLVNNVQDITAQKHHEEQLKIDKLKLEALNRELLLSSTKLQQSENHFRTLISNLPDTDVYLFDREYKFIIAGGTELIKNGKLKVSLEGKLLTEISEIDIDVKKQLLHHYDAVIQGQSINNELLINNQSYSYQGIPLYNNYGMVYGGIAFIQNTTKLKAAERKIQTLYNNIQKQNRELSNVNVELLLANEELQHTQHNLIIEKEKYSTIAENLPNGKVLLFDKNLNHYLVNGNNSDNNAFNEMFNNEILLNKTLYDSLPPEMVELMEPFYLKALEGIQSKFEIQLKNTFFEIQTVPIKQADNVINAGMVLAQDITDLKNVEIRTNEALQKEKELNQMKSDFISIASHQFRTPLATIQSSVDILKLYFEKLNIEDSTLFIKHYSRVRSEIGRLTELMNDILTIGNYDTGKIAFNPVATDIVALCKNMVYSQFSDLLNGKNLSFVSEVITFNLLIDIKLFHQVLSNLISNALKYSKQNIELTLNVNQNFVEISVSDDGVGIPKEDQSKIFNSFFRGSNVANTQGTGLGLVVVKRFVEMHGGTIEFESEPFMKTVFKINIPITN